MFLTQGQQQQAVFLNPFQPGCNDANDLVSSSSWDTNFSDEFPGAAGLRGSPLGPLAALDRAHSCQLPCGLNPGMASLSMADSLPLNLAQAGVGDQTSMGWGGRPLNPTSTPPKLQQPSPHNGYRGGRRSDDYSSGSLTPPPGGPHHSHNHAHHRANNRQGQQPPHRGRNGPGGLSNGGGHRANNAQGRGGGGGNGGNTNNNHVKGGNNHGNYRRLWQQVTAVNRGGCLGDSEGPPFGEATVEDLLATVRQLPADASAVQAVAQGLYCLDSGALAALLKELNKAGHARRAQEIFDWLRGLDPAHDLSSLCNTMTYTTMISQCGSQQALRRALELMAEMRSRGVQCNVHTYSALMNVCIKASELDLALDVYRQMVAEGCTPNLVTYNTLIDVYGKTGAWEEAVAVLDVLESQGIDPEVRTYNTVIIACNQSSRAAEALRVYERMLVAGAAPTATTYTALISAYGKAGQLDAALQIFQDMLRRGCERNVITYSSLISACEKAGRWELALELFSEMHAEGCRPNVVTYNSLIAACAQGAQWGKAQELFEQMQAKGCRPDAVTFGGLIAAYDRAGLWRRALAAFEQMRGMSCRPDTVVYNTVVGALWRTGLLWAQARAVQIFQAACRQGHFRLTVHTVPAGGGAGSGGGGPSSPSEASRSPNAQAATAVAEAAALYRMGSCLASEVFSSGDLDCPTTAFANLSPDDLAALASACPSPAPTADSNCSPTCGLSPAPSLGATAANTSAGCCGGGGVTIEFGMHAFTLGSAMLSLLRWVSELRDRLPRDASRVDPTQSVALVLNKGKPSREHTYPAIKSALTTVLEAWGSPFVLRDVPQGCRIEAGSAEAGAWLGTPAAELALKALPQASARGAGESPGGGGGQNAASRDSIFLEDAAVERRCAEAFAAVRRFENGYEAGGGGGEAPAAAAAQSENEESGNKEPLSPSEPPSNARRPLFQATADLGRLFGYSDEVVYDAFLLLDRAMEAAGDKALGVSLAAAVVASLIIAARQAGEQSPHGPVPTAADRAAGLRDGDSEAALTVVRSLLGGDTASISSLRVLKLYLERLGADFSGLTSQNESLWPAAGAALKLLPEVVCDAELRKEAPSTLAAAAMLAGRRAGGRTPFWPSALEALTGMGGAPGTKLATVADRALAALAASTASST